MRLYFDKPGWYLMEGLSQEQVKGIGREGRDFVRVNPGFLVRCWWDQEQGTPN